MQGPYDIDVSAVLRIEDPAEPLPLLRQEAGVLGVAAPVLEVGLLVGDVPVAADDDLAPVGGGPLAQRLQVGEELPHEADLLVLAGGADLAGGEVEGGDRDTRQVDLDVAPAGLELGHPEADLDTVELAAGVEGDAGAPPGGRRGRDPLPAPRRGAVAGP